MIAIRASVAFTVALFVCTPSRPENVPIHYIYIRMREQMR